MLDIKGSPQETPSPEVNSQAKAVDAPIQDTPATAAVSASVATAAAAMSATTPVPAIVPATTVTPGVAAASTTPATPTTPAAPAAPAAVSNDVATPSSAPTTAEPEATATPSTPAFSPTSPVITPARPTVALTFSETIMDETSDTEVMDEPAQVEDVMLPKKSEAIGASLKENGTEPMEVDEIRTEVDEIRMQRNKIEELEMDNINLRVQLEDTVNEKRSVGEELNRTRGAYHDLHRQHMELQQKLAKRDRDYDVMSKNYLEHVRLIRATDDDHSTIMERLTQLKVSIEHLIRKAQGGRSVNLNKEAALEHFKSSGLLEAFPVPEDKLEPYHLNLYMESVVMSTLVSRFFDKPLCCVFEHNQGFKEIYDWMLARNQKLAVRWRQQLCVMLTQDPITRARQEEEVTATAKTLSELITNVYANANELAKIRDICNRAFELAIAMTALESVISPTSVPLGTQFDEENMGSSLKSNPDGKVALVIFPAFRDSECAFDVRPKVWCH
ncbi:hypothetical protein BG011_001786 [Mortierella polycephala]|uniref:Uncharacterized protein n=1 Tax=Mortierella polycephala TaxID=41804 RepID=A0A9P6UAR5_9FUNG|nr:hypothetical protein BG011_001786 [Mortierella polycephala]